MVSSERGAPGDSVGSREKEMATDSKARLAGDVSDEEELMTKDDAQNDPKTAHMEEFTETLRKKERQLVMQERTNRRAGRPVLYY